MRSYCIKPCLLLLSLYYGSSGEVHRKLQCVLNAAARLVTGQHRQEHISCTLKDLHWLHVPQRVTYKVASLTRSCLLHQALSTSVNSLLLSTLYRLDPTFVQQIVEI